MLRLWVMDNLLEFIMLTCVNHQSRIQQHQTSEFARNILHTYYKPKGFYQCKNLNIFWEKWGMGTLKMSILIQEQVWIFISHKSVLTVNGKCAFKVKSSIPEVLHWRHLDHVTSHPGLFLFSCGHHLLVMGHIPLLPDQTLWHMCLIYLVSVKRNRHFMLAAWNLLFGKVAIILRSGTDFCK